MIILSSLMKCVATMICQIRKEVKKACKKNWKQCECLV